VFWKEKSRSSENGGNLTQGYIWVTGEKRWTEI